MKSLASPTFPLNGNRLIEASAGTGKTYTITNLYLRLLLGREATPRKVSDILVLTFTNAATEELRGRIRQRVTDARHAIAAGESDDEFLQYLVSSSTDPRQDGRILAAALRLMDEAAIFTIHGFCSRVLSDHAFETATLFNQNLDADRDLLLATAAEDCFRGFILTRQAPVRQIALSLWRTPAILGARVGQFLFRHNLAMLPPYRELPHDELAEKIREAKLRWLEEDFESAIRDAQLYANSRAVTNLAAMSAWCETESLDTDMWQIWTSDALAGTKFRKGGHTPEHSLIALIDEICTDLEQVQHNLWHDARRIMAENLARYKAELGQLTLDDLLTGVYQALTSPATGEQLASQLAARWPVAMIDEFQDTDDVQYGIFEQIYHNAGDTGLVFIGDPKQAIYQFRGADVFTYINARRAVSGDDIYSLVTNWRSSTAMIEATNRLFKHEDIFGNDEDIPFVPASPSPNADKRQLDDRGKSPVPVTLYQVTGDDLNADSARRLAMGFAAEETSRLLSAAARGEVTIDGEPLRAGHIAFLVRSRAHAEKAREALYERGIRSVYVTQDSVFATDTADDLYLVLRAVLEHTNDGALRTALATPLLQATAADIDVLSHDVAAQQALLDEFADYHELWARFDIATMISALTVRRGIARHWLSKPDGERQMTNLRHLTELLQRQAAVSPGMRLLLKWFADERRNEESVAAEDRQLRLESDKNLVQIVTMHSAKGLEYEVVMIPEASFTARAGGAPYLYHDIRDGKFRTCVDVSGSDAAKDATRREQEAEDLRLLYVAITRAKLKCYIGFASRDLRKSAFSSLLPVTEFDDDAVEASLRKSLPDSLFDIHRITEVDITPCEFSVSSEPLRPPAAPPDTRSTWRLHSYTGVARRISFDETVPDADEFQPGFGDDELAAAPTTGYRPSRFNFPRGPRAGIALHSLLEGLDFTCPPADQADAVGQCLDRVGIVRNRDEWSRVLTDWMQDVLATPIEDGVCLAGIGAERRLDELEFHFPLDTRASFLDLLKDAGYLMPGSTLGVDLLQGMMTGLMDLVFESGGKYYLVDYKSNHLGDNPGDYGQAHLTEAVRQHQYDLQYLIYSVALARYLRRRLTNFDYDRDFGGVAYLFLRGMNGTDNTTGIYADKPDAAFIARLDQVLGGGA